MKKLLLFVSVLLFLSHVLRAQQCNAIQTGSVANFTSFPPAYLSVTGSWTPVTATPGPCGGNCIFKWNVNMTIRSPGTGSGPDLLLCGGNSPLAMTCGKFFWPGAVDASGDYVQSMNETFVFEVVCGLSLIFTLDVVQLLGNINLVSVTMTCGQCEW